MKYRFSADKLYPCCSAFVDNISAQVVQGCAGSTPLKYFLIQRLLMASFFLTNRCLRFSTWCACLTLSLLIPSHDSWHRAVRVFLWCSASCGNSSSQLLSCVPFASTPLKYFIIQPFLMDASSLANRVFKLSTRLAWAASILSILPNVIWHNSVLVRCSPRWPTSQITDVPDGRI